MLTKKEIALIKRAGACSENRPIVIGDIFYSNLFIENPELRKMFPRDMEGQDTANLWIC